MECSNCSGRNTYFWTVTVERVIAVAGRHTFLWGAMVEIHTFEKCLPPAPFPYVILFSSHILRDKNVFNTLFSHRFTGNELHYVLQLITQIVVSVIILCYPRSNVAFSVQARWLRTCRVHAKQCRNILHDSVIDDINKVKDQTVIFPRVEPQTTSYHLNYKYTRLGGSRHHDGVHCRDVWELH